MELSSSAGKYKAQGMIPKTEEGLKKEKKKTYCLTFRILEALNRTYKCFFIIS